MIAAISKVIAAALGSVGAYFAWKACAIRQRHLAASDVAQEDAAVEAKKNEIREAVYKNDDEKLNQIVNKLLED